MKFLVRTLIKYRKHLIYLGLILLSALCMFTTHIASFMRAVQAVRDLGISIAYWFLWFIGIDPPFINTVNTYDLSILERYTTVDLEEIMYKFDHLIPTLFSKDPFISYCYYVLNILYYIAKFALPGILLWLLSKLLFRMILIAESDLTENTKQLDFFLEKILPKLKTAKSIFVRFIKFGTNLYLKILAVIWFINLNLFTILISAFAYYFCLCAAIRELFSSVVIQLGKLILDLIIMFASAPTLFWVVFLYIVFDKIRMLIGYKRLERKEELNKKVVEDLPLASLLCGYMEAGKTSTMVDMSLSLCEMFRMKALSTMQKIWLRFPDFPYWRFECDLDDMVISRELPNNQFVREHISDLRKKFLLYPTSENIFGYDISKFKLFDDNALTVDFLYKLLEEYAQAYVIYTVATSLIYANLAIRDEGQRIDKGHFPLWRYDYFRAPSVKHFDNAAHVLDYDMMRPGKRHNPKTFGFYDYGVIVCDEFGKEVGNQNTNARFKWDDPEPNPKNDLMNLYLKLARHLSTVAYFPFIKFFFAEQRADNVAADYKEVNMIVHMKSSKEEKIAMPFFTLTKALNDKLTGSFLDFFTEYRLERDDRGLLIYLLHHAVAAFDGFVTRRVNTFGYKCNTLALEDGTQEGETTEVNHYLLYKKIYPWRFATDCNHAMFEEDLARCEKCILDRPTYKDKQPSKAEYEAHHSRYVKDMFERRNRKDDLQ